MSHKVIAICSQKRHGKNITSDFLCSLLNNENQRWYDWSFARRVKEIFCLSFNVDMKFIERWKTIDSPPPNWSKSVRDGLKAIGDGLRKINPRIWIDHYFNTVPGNSIANDGRYSNEWVEIRKRGGVNVLLIRSGFINDDPNESESEIRPWLEKYQNHEDGKITDPDCPFDFLLKNDGDIDCLYFKIQNLLVPFLREKSLI